MWQIYSLFLINLNKNSIFDVKLDKELSNPKKNEMTDMNPIYYNQFGVAFQWRRNNIKDILKIQIVFRDTGLLLSKEELIQFSKNIKFTKENNMSCQDCMHNESCKALLVDSPAPQITFAMNTQELNAVDDLVTGTLFQMNLENYLDYLCEND